MFSFLDNVTSDIIHYEGKKVGSILSSLAFSERLFCLCLACVLPRESLYICGGASRSEIVLYTRRYFREVLIPATGFSHGCSQ
jgi:hypothetical protein